MSRKPTLPLDVRTLRWVARQAMKATAQLAMSDTERVFNEAMAYVAKTCRNEARAIERKRPKLTPATPRESKGRKVKAR